MDPYRSISAQHSPACRSHGWPAGGSTMGSLKTDSIPPRPALPRTGARHQGRHRAVVHNNCQNWKPALRCCGNLKTLWRVSVGAQRGGRAAHRAKSQRQAAGVISAPTTCTTAPPARQPSCAHLRRPYPRISPNRNPAANWSPAPAQALARVSTLAAAALVARLVDGKSSRDSMALLRMCALALN